MDMVSLNYPFFFAVHDRRYPLARNDGRSVADELLCDYPRRSSRADTAHGHHNGTAEEDNSGSPILSYLRSERFHLSLILADKKKFVILYEFFNNVIGLCHLKVNLYFHCRSVEV